jgi:hypothetical protein
LKKSGSASPRRVFRKMLRDIIAADLLPEYRLAEEPGDMIRVTPRAGLIEGATVPVLAARTLAAARALAPGADVHALEAEWRGVWQRSGRPRLYRPDAAFLGWLRKR